MNTARNYVLNSSSIKQTCNASIKACLVHFLLLFSVATPMTSLAVEVQLFSHATTLTYNSRLDWGRIVGEFILPEPDARLGAFTGGEINVFTYADRFYGEPNLQLVQPPPFRERYIQMEPGAICYFDNKYITVGSGSVYYATAEYNENGQLVYNVRVSTHWRPIKFHVIKNDFKGGNLTVYDAVGGHYGYPQYECNTAESWAICNKAVLGNLGAIMRAEIYYVYQFDVDESNLLAKMSLWLDNVSLKNLSNLIREVSPKSAHVVERKQVSFGVRDGSACELCGGAFNGKSIFTQSPGMLVYDITLPDASYLNLPIAFEENNLGASIEVQFNGITLYQASGEDFNLDELTTLNLDIDAYRGQTGELSIILNNDGSQSARVFIPESIVMDEVQTTYYAPGFGNDSIDGGAGTDTVVLTGLASNHSFALLADASVLAQSGDASSLLNSIEIIQFGDGSSHSMMSLLPRATLDAPAYHAKVQAYFFTTIGRAATDSELANYSALLATQGGSVWKDSAGVGGNSGSLVGALFASAEFGALTSALADSRNYGQIVNDMFGRLTGQSTLDTSIYDYYVSQLSRGGIKLRGLANAMLNDLSLMPRNDNMLSQPNGWPVNWFENLAPVDYLGYLKKLELAGINVSNLDDAGVLE